MLSFSWYARVREHNLYIFPKFISLQSLNYIKLQCFRYSPHKLSARCNYILIKLFFILIITAKFYSFILPFSFDFLLCYFFLFNIESTSKSSWSLLVHLCSWSYTINSHVKDLFGFNYFHYFIYIVKDIVKHITFTFRLRLILWMCAWMNNTIHIEIKIIKFRIIILDFLLNFCI